MPALSQLLVPGVTERQPHVLVWSDVTHSNLDAETTLWPESISNQIAALLSLTLDWQRRQKMLVRVT